MAETHAARRRPETPESPLDLDAAADDLRAEASRMAAGRASRTLTPGAHAPLKQTMIALRAGVALSEHTTNGPATIHLLRGEATINTSQDSVELSAGQWAVVPPQRHDLRTSADTVALITIGVVAR